MGLAHGSLIEGQLAGFGSAGPATLDWSLDSPTAECRLRSWNSGYAGRSAAWCNAGAGWGSELTTSGKISSFISFFFGGDFNTTKTIAWALDDLADVTISITGRNPVADGTNGLLVALDKTSSTGFRPTFGPDGDNRSISDITYSDGPDNGGRDAVAGCPRRHLRCFRPVRLAACATGGLAALRRRKPDPRPSRWQGRSQATGLFRATRSHLDGPDRPGLGCPCQKARWALWTPPLQGV
jgi:hypothetical protein